MFDTDMIHRVVNEIKEHGLPLLVMDLDLAFDAYPIQDVHRWFRDNEAEIVIEAMAETGIDIAIVPTDTDVFIKRTAMYRTRTIR